MTRLRPRAAGYLSEGRDNTLHLVQNCEDPRETEVPFGFST
jgi:hypothetical protein